VISQLMSFRAGIIILLFFILRPICLTAGIEIVEEELLSKERSNPVDELFPCPSSIVPQVEFWKKIFTRYNSSQVLVHDAWQLDRIYEVVDFMEISNGDSVNYFRKWKTVLAIRDQYIRQLYFLHKLPKGSPRIGLSPVQKRLVNMLSSDTRPDKYKIAAENVRIQFGLSDRFKEGIEILGKYRPFMADIFDSYKLPLELLVIPLYESSFVLRALSMVQAAGVWQFMPNTARKYMRVDNLVDERYDPLISTVGAAELLYNNYKYSKSWPLAITSYNHGLGGMLNAKRILGTDDIGVIIHNYQSPSFGFSSRNFYPEFLAALYCLRNMYDLYNNIAFEPKWNFTTTNLKRSATLSHLSSVFGLSIDTIYEYNPSFREPVLKSFAPLWEGYKLRLPVSSQESLKKIEN
jgi:membrane-bound lytic murein transglycosylase D